VPVRRWRNLSTGITATTPESGEIGVPGFQQGVEQRHYFRFLREDLDLDVFGEPVAATTSGGTIATTYLKFMIFSLFYLV